METNADIRRNENGRDRAAWRDGSRGERVAISAATQAQLRPSVESDLGDVWCSRCANPSVTYVGNDAACRECALPLAAEKLLARVDGGDDFSEAVTDLRGALRVSAEPISEPSPDVIARAEREGTYAY